MCLLFKTKNPSAQRIKELRAQLKYEKESRQSWVGKTFVGIEVLETKYDYSRSQTIVSHRRICSGTIEQVGNKCIKISGLWYPLNNNKNIPLPGQVIMIEIV